MIYLTEIETNRMIHMEPQKTQDSHIKPQRKKKNNGGKITSGDIKRY